MEKMRLDADLLSVQSFPSAAALAAARPDTQARGSAPDGKLLHPSDGGGTCRPSDGAA